MSGTFTVMHTSKSDQLIDDHRGVLHILAGGEGEAMELLNKRVKSGNSNRKNMNIDKLSLDFF